MSEHDYSDYEHDDLGSPADDSDVKRHARAQHNALERRRRDNIKDMYQSIKEVVNEAHNERLSRSQILKKTIDRIENNDDKLKQLENEVRQLEKEIADNQRKVDEEKAKINVSSTS
ncbi:hypothetical protein L596_012358 [Steinernema carpocapsae]|uniref:BHLH domain-containing protein n=1 Tax=Steinernema carpocapsae TaxID=34508 RepID=A0A4U5NXG7_STECR|nr:hypothetical protein L596_012358 [Steinernema carpocapsae]